MIGGRVTAELIRQDGSVLPDGLLFEGVRAVGAGDNEWTVSLNVETLQATFPFKVIKSSQ